MDGLQEWRDRCARAMGWFWAHSEDSESWFGPFTSKDAAIEAAKQDELVQDNFFCVVAQGEPTDPSQAIDAEHIFETWGDANPELSPLEDSWQGFWGASKEQMDELTRLLRDVFKLWAGSHRMPEWHTIGELGFETVRFDDAALKVLEG